jgi:hypothetical protein
MRRRRLLAAAAATIVGGCAPLPPDDRRPPRPQPPQPEPPRPRIVARLDYRDAPNQIRVERAGRLTPVSDGMALFENDFVETISSNAGIDFSPGDVVWLDKITRVRVGSLWLIFGQIFASVSSPFSVETEDVTASSEGTKFGVRRDKQKGDYAVVVETGKVRVTGKKSLRFEFVVQAKNVLIATPLAKPDPPKLVPPKELQREIGWALPLRAIRGERPDLKVPLKAPPTPGVGTPR